MGSVFRSVSWFVPLVFLGLGAPDALAGSTLIFPRLSFENGRFTGIAIANPTARQAFVTMTAYGADGRQLSGSKITNPATITIPPGQQRSKTTAEIFGTGLNPATVGWFQGLSAADGLTGFFLYLDSGVTLLDGADLPVRAQEVVFNEIRCRDGFSTEINIVNSESKPTTVDLTLGGGATTLTKSVALAARGVARFDVAEFFQSENLPEAASLRAVSSTQIAGFEMVRGKGDVLGLNARPADEKLNTLYFPQFAVLGNPAFRSEITVVNYGQESAILTISAFRSDGKLFDQRVLLNNPVVRSLGPLQTVRLDVTGLFGFLGTALQSGWIAVEANRESINGCLSYSQPTLKSLAAVAPQPHGATTALFSHIATTMGYFTGLAILNPGALAANLRIVALKADGSRLGTFTGILRPRERVSSLINEWIPGSVNQAGGMMWVTADVPVQLTALFINSGGGVISNVPPQPVPDAFQPDQELERMEVVPRLAILPPGQSQVFLGQGTTSRPAWSVDGVVGGNAVSGTVTGTGSYRAPASVPATLPVAVSAAVKDQAAAASVDVLDKKVLAGQLGLLQTVAYLESTKHLYTAELEASSGTGHFGPQGTATVLRDVTSGTPLLLATYAGEEVPKMIAWQSPGGNSFLLLAAKTTGRILRFNPVSRETVVVASGLNAPVSMVIEPQTGDLLVAQKDSVVTVPSSRLAVAESGPAPADWDPPRAEWAQMLPASASGLAVDRCTGKFYLSVPTQGAILSFDPSISEWNTVASGLNDPGQLLGIYRAGYSCPASFHLLVVERALGRVVLVVPREGRVLPWLDAPGIADICYLPPGSSFSSGAGVFLGEAPDDVGRVILVETPGLYTVLSVNPPLLLQKSQGWEETTALPVARLLSVTDSPGNGYLYAMNGYTNSSACSWGYADGRVFFAPIQWGGEVGAWQETKAGPPGFARAAAGVAHSNGYIYLAGGAVNAPEWDGSIWYAKPEADGGIPSWTSASLPPPSQEESHWLGSWPVVAANNGYLYVGGGRIAYGGYSDRLYYAKLNADGSPGTWTQITLPSPSSQGQLLFYGGRAYLILGIDNCDSCVSDKVFIADVASNGSLGTWRAARALPEVARTASAQVVDGHIVVIPGGTSVYQSPIQSDGSLGVWVTIDTLPESSLVSYQGTFVGGYYYIAGDQNCGASQDRLQRVYYSRIGF